jgi:4a-hydroxytetrahydrobiopterin dehydratase
VERRKLNETEIEERIAKLNGWKNAENKLNKRFEFSNFAGSLVFVNLAGEIAEKHDHHPDITFGWGYAEVFLTTHDRGGITEIDFVVAGEIDSIKR